MKAITPAGIKSKIKKEEEERIKNSKSLKWKTDKKRRALIVGGRVCRSYFETNSYVMEALRVPREALMRALQRSCPEPSIQQLFSVIRIS